jgi:putative FmdB family regulatory protein
MPIERCPGPACREGWQFGRGVNSGRVYGGVPTYAYRCEAGHQFEAVQGITAPALTACTTCGAPVHRVVFPVGIVFKGQGFYKNDSRSSSSSSIAPASSDNKEPTPAGTSSVQADPGTAATKTNTPKKDSASDSAAAGKSA